MFMQWHEYVRSNGAAVDAKNLFEPLQQACLSLPLALQAILEGPPLL